MDLDALPPVMGPDGEFHAIDEAVDLSRTTPEAWLSLLLSAAALGATRLRGSRLRAQVR